MSVFVRLGHEEKQNETLAAREQLGCQPLADRSRKCEDFSNQGRRVPL